MKQILLLSILLTISFTVQAQFISKQVIGSLGQPISNGANTINFTVGEPIVGKIENGISISQGFWSSVASDATLSVETIVSNTIEGIKVFPNPTVDFIQVTFKLNKVEDFNVRLFDISGKEIINLYKTTQGQIKRINMSHLSIGMYLLYVTDSKSNYNKSFKILKQ